MHVVQAPQYLILLSKKNVKYLKYSLGLDTVCIMVYNSIDFIRKNKLQFIRDMLLPNKSI